MNDQDRKLLIAAGVVVFGYASKKAWDRYRTIKIMKKVASIQLEGSVIIENARQRIREAYANGATPEEIRAIMDEESAFLEIAIITLTK